MKPVRDAPPPDTREEADDAANERWSTDEIERAIIELRADGRPNAEIAQALGMSHAMVGWHVGNLITAGRLQSRGPARWTLDARIITLRNEGKSLAQIARDLDRSYPTVAGHVSRLIKAGQLQSQQRNVPGRTRKRSHKLDARIIELRNAGKTNAAIAAALGLAPTTVTAHVYRLITEGKLQRTKRASRNAARDAQIMDMVRNRATLQEIADALGCTRENARQLIKRIRRTYGSAALDPTDSRMTINEVAHMLNAPYATIYALCKSGAVQCKPTGRRRYLISAEGMAALRQHPSITHVHTCPFCGREYTFKSKKARRCKDPACRKAYHALRHKRYATQRASLETLRGWVRTFAERRAQHRNPDDERWVAWAAAKRHAGVTHIQLRWITLRKLITTRPHPTKRWKEKPVTLYAVSELELLREVCAAHAHTTKHP